MEYSVTITLKKRTTLLILVFVKNRILTSELTFDDLESEIRACAKQYVMTDG